MLIKKACSLLGLKRKQGVLVTEGVPEASVAFELAETRGDHWLTSGWSLDAITTTARAGLGIAKDIYEGRNLEIDLGGYVTQTYEGLLESKLAPDFGLGLNVRF